MAKGISLVRENDNLNDVSGQLLSRFRRPLDDYSDRRLLIWHDSDDSFEEEFEQMKSMAAEGELSLERPLRLLKVDEGSAFALKRLVYREEPYSDFLIYSRSQKDLSPHGLEGNWLADIELIAEHFQADFSSMLLDELGAEDGALDGIERFKTFFGAVDRKKKFMRLMHHAQSKEDVALGVIGALLGASGLSTSQILKVYLVSLQNDGTPLDDLAKYGADGPFASFVASRLGFSGDLQSANDLAIHVLLSALSCTLPEGTLSGLESRMSLPHGQLCLNVVGDWVRDDSFVDELFELCRSVEQICHIEQRFSKMSCNDLMESDVLPCINELALIDLMSSLANGADRVDEVAAFTRRRKDLAWYSRVAPYFDALSAAADAARFYREHAQGFHCAVPVDVWRSYTSDWYRMDTYYRRFFGASDECLLSGVGIPEDLDAALENLATWMERVYTNWFLSDSNSCWVNACEKQWFDQGYVEGVGRQQRFFDERVLSGANGAKKTLVVVSDALRYEVATELAERLERDTKGTAELDSMQSVFPSVTEFGMAALLPHNTMSYDWNSGAVSCDGMSAMNTKEREAVLQAYKPKSRAIQSKELLSAKRTERKTLVGDAEVVYVYHNKIDATGEKYATESDVFEACDTAIDDLVAIVRIATNDLAISRVVITADHGFIYTREALDEHDKVGKSDINADTVRLGRRYAILDDAVLEDALFIKMNMDDVQGGVYMGISPRECVRIKKPGDGERYVHGGASLQEMCVPVIQFRNRKGGSKGFVDRQDATLKLLSPSRQVNSMVFRVQLFQPEAVGGKVLPAVYDLVMVDDGGIEVSNIASVHADMGDADDKARVASVQLSLRAGREYSPRVAYFLVCRAHDSSQPIWQEKFTIDIAFAPMDDFGF